jgi:hypothetical protein
MGRWKLDRPLENNKKWSSCITSVADANVDIGLKNRDVCWRRPYLQTWAPPPSPVSSGKAHICRPGLHPPPRVPPLLPPRHPTLSALHVLLRSLPCTAARSLWRHRMGHGGRPSPQTSCPAPNGASVGSRSRGMDACSGSKVVANLPLLHLIVVRRTSVMLMVYLILTSADMLL